MHKETKKLDASISDGSWKKGVGLYADRHWNHCFALLHTPDVKVWWQENFKDHAVLITAGARTVSQFLSGDANISSGSSSYHPSSGIDAAPDGNSGKRARIANPTKPNKATGPKIDVEEMLACKQFNNGQCPGDVGQVCPKNDRLCHKCSQCGSKKHGISDCPQKMARNKAKGIQGAPWKNKNGEGGGKKGAKW